jgi:hypothetical protein
MHTEVCNPVCVFDPEGIRSISRGLSAAIPPVKVPPSVIDPEGIGLSEDTIDKKRVDANLTHALNPIPSGSKKGMSSVSGGIASLNPRLIDLIPSGSKTRSSPLSPGRVEFQDFNGFRVPTA